MCFTQVGLTSLPATTLSVASGGSQKSPAGSRDSYRGKAAEPILNMIEWWLCLNMPPDEVNKIARFRELNDAQKKPLSARKESGKLTEGVILSKSTEVLFRAVPPSLHLAMAMTESGEKADRFRLMNELGISELDAAMAMAKVIDQNRGIRCA